MALAVGAVAVGREGDGAGWRRRLGGVARGEGLPSSFLCQSGALRCCPVLCAHCIKECIISK